MRRRWPDILGITGIYQKWNTGRGESNESRYFTAIFYRAKMEQKPPCAYFSKKKKTARKWGPNAGCSATNHSAKNS
jgi:hypothetical protein